MAIRRTWLLSLTGIVALSLSSIVYLFVVESPLVQHIVQPLGHRGPVPYHKVSMQLLLSGGIHGISPLNTQRRQPHAFVHMVWVMKDPALDCNLTGSYVDECLLESLAKHAYPWSNIIVWLVYPPNWVLPSECKLSSSRAITTHEGDVLGWFNVTRLVIERSNGFGVWYHEANHSIELWQRYTALISDFMRLYILSVLGGVYLDGDVLVIDRMVASLCSGAMVNGGGPFGAHRLANTVMSFESNSIFSQLALEDWIYYWDAPDGPNIKSYGFFGPGLITRVYAKLVYTLQTSEFLPWPTNLVANIPGGICQITDRPSNNTGVFHFMHGAFKSWKNRTKILQDMTSCPGVVQSLRRACPRYLQHFYGT